MITRSKYFSLRELVCPHVQKKHWDKSWQFIDPKLIYVLDTIRERLDKPIYVNTGKLTQRGLRCIHCEIVKDKIAKGELYMSAHLLGKAVDFSVKGMEAEEVRLWIAKNGHLLPYPVRLESGVSWVHLDVYETDTDQKVYFFNARSMPPVKVNAIWVVKTGIKLYRLIKKLIRQINKGGKYVLKRIFSKPVRGDNNA